MAVISFRFCCADIQRGNLAGGGLHTPSAASCTPNDDTADRRKRPTQE
jgi:hypothetical protein